LYLPLSRKCAPDPVGVELVSSSFHLSVHLSNRVSSRERRLATSLVSFSVPDSMQLFLTPGKHPCCNGSNH
jgi:hypothetical protein